jgi:hypothetical protein
MLKQIVHPSQQLRAFLLSLGLALSRPQFTHLWRLTDALITVETKHKTLAALYRSIVDAPDASAAADFLRESPWDSEDSQQAARQFVVQDLVTYAEEEGLEKVIFASLDDSLGEKDKTTQRLEGVDWHHDHSQSTRQKPCYSKGTVHLELRLSLGERSYAFDWRIYLRESTVRRLNRQRQEQRLKYRSKYALRDVGAAKGSARAISCTCFATAGMPPTSSSSTAFVKAGSLSLHCARTAA